jgi:5-deoxy-glucuronate isomerase
VTRLHLTSAGAPVEVTPESAGWQFTGLRILRLQPNAAENVRTGPAEAFVLPLTGAVTVDVSDTTGRPEARFELSGRRSVFTAVTDFCYAGRDSVLTLRSAQGAEVALPSARCERRLAARYGPAEQVPVEVRGAGPATRQVTNFGVPGVWDTADRLMCCELITPPGNWSSYPPHKHDSTDPCAVANEEIYYYRIAGPDQVTPGRDGFGLHRSYTGPEHDKAGLAALDVMVEVRDGDVVLIPHGYHGPSVAAVGYPMYYLNVLAGPGPARSMAFCDDPAHAWIRDSWAGLDPDPRVPVTSPAGRVSEGRR